MKGNRHVNVFYRSDGRCVHEKPWDDEHATHSSDPVDSPSIPSSTLWPLIQVFIQFAREVQGGSVKRLVFRNPEEYAPSVQRFRSAPQQRNTEDKHPVVVHVAHDDLFVVAVTEILPADPRNADFAAEGPEGAPVLTIAEFCESCLDFLSQEQTAFLATLARDDFARGRPVATHISQRSGEEEALQRASASNFRIGGGMSSSSASRTSSMQSDLTGSFDDLVQPAPAVTRDPIVSINESRLSEYISKTQTLLRM